MEKDFIGYEYKDVVVRKEREALWIDSMKNYGWQCSRSHPAIVKHIWGPFRVMAAPLALLPGTPFAKMIVDHNSDKKVELAFKRDKNIENKAELVRLQRLFETYAAELDELEDSKKTGAAAVSSFLGIAGTVLLGVSTFSYLAGNIPLCIVTAVPGFLGWVIPVFLYSGLKGIRTRKVEPVMEEKQEEISKVNEQSYLLLQESQMEEKNGRKR